jgi:hypothetical protein
MRILTQLLKWTGKFCPKCLEVWYKCKCSILLLMFPLFLTAQSAQLKITDLGTQIHLQVIPSNLTAPIHTYTFINHNPYTEWYSNLPYKYLPNNSGLYQVKMQGITYTPHQPIQVQYTIHTNQILHQYLTSPLITPFITNERKRN